jgi:type III restriction enzyme
MKFTLKDYQEDAVGDVLVNMRKASKRWREDGDLQAFSLTATTGAGKTVMAAAVFEALFYGDDAFDFEANPGAVIIWFSDDPSLNEQTRFRLLEASDKLDTHDLVVVENTFNREKFEPGKIYFLNTQKLSKNSLLVRGHSDPLDQNPDQLQLYPDARPDMRAYTIWDTIQNTIEDSSLTLHLVLDEAHRGMGKSTETKDAEKSTIVKRLINGSGSVPPIPVVWGISATVKKFNNAVKEAKSRIILPNVEVDSQKVQDSGLIKDTIILDIPAEVGKFDTVLVRRGTEKIKESTAAWLDYTSQQEGNESVIPLMVLQVPNTPNPEDIGRTLDTIYQEWPELKENAIAHVFGEHVTQTFGRHSVQYIAPQNVQETTTIRILIAKDAISTGWDCPRAEVMVSFRPAKDQTHITQLLGRMVRTPLARRIPGNEKLNSVNCLLPFFDAEAVEAVADALMKGGVDEGESNLSGRKVLIDPIEMHPNADISEKLWNIFESLPSQSLPKKEAKPIKRLTALAQELAADELLEGAGKHAHAEMHKALDDARALYADKIKKARAAVLIVEGKSLKTDLKSQSKTFDEFVEDADYSVINDSYRRAARGISPDLARTYAEYLASENGDPESIEEALIESQTTIAAIGLVPEILDYLESKADALAKTWLSSYNSAIKSLSDERKETYRILRSWSKEPVDIDLIKPGSWMVATTLLENEAKTPLPKFKDHLMCDVNDKLFPCQLNIWETKVLETEMASEEFMAWYRNPGNAIQESLGISYQEDKLYDIVRPDFIFFSQGKDRSISVDIIDPHGYHLSDSLSKLVGLANYANTHKLIYRRIEAVAEVEGKLKFLDLTDEKIRSAVYKAKSAKSLYESSLAKYYLR